MKRRILAALAALALSATALFGAATAANADEAGGAAYVALGDSEAAGTGNLPYADPSCLGSKKAYPMLLGATLGVTAVSAACAGATTSDTATQAYTLAGMGSLGDATQLVTITAGVNNLDWQGVLTACSSAGTAAACQAAMDAAAAAAAGVPLGIAQLVGQVRTLAPHARIVVTGYPLLFGAVADSCSVGAYQGTPVKFTAQQAGAANAGLAGVNGAIQSGVALYQSAFAAAYGGPDPAAGYLDVTAAFAGHALCDTGDRWISGLVSGKATRDRAFHPNAAGQQAYAMTIAAALAG